jgi:hypothetical protein
MKPKKKRKEKKVKMEALVGRRCIWRQRPSKGQEKREH